MTTDAVSTFEDSLAALEVDSVRTSADGFEDALSETVVEPAVGAPLPFDDLTLDGTTVETDPSPADLDAARTGVTAARMAIADTGSIAIRSTAAFDEPISLFAERHVAVLDADDVVEDVAAAFDQLGPWLADDRASAIVATGPSATADMGELVLGAHGPREVCVVIVDR